MNPAFRKPLLALTLLGLFLVLLPGCDRHPYYHDHDYPYDDYSAPAPPENLTSVTGDEEVYLDWDPSPSYDVDGYYVWRSTSESGRYYYQATVYHTYYTDRDVWNGATYFYAVSAFDDAGNESRLTQENVFDTPRPEGYGEELWDGMDWPDESGYDFSEVRVQPWDYPSSDVYMVRDTATGAYLIVAANAQTDIIDMGHTRDLTDITWAPETGWAIDGYVEGNQGHSIVVWTADNHFAHMRVTSVGGGRLIFDWAYQTDTGNPELKIRLTQAKRSLPPLLAARQANNQ